MRHARDPRQMAGLLLIVGGLLWILIAITGLDDTVVVTGLGPAFFVAYLVTRRYALLVLAGILTGLGIGAVVAAQNGPDEAVPLGLGLGFVSITVVDAMLGEDGAARWPLVPGGILTAVGAAQIAEVRDVGIYVIAAVLILIGLLLLRQSRGRAGTTRKGDQQETPTHHGPNPPDGRSHGTGERS